MRLWHQALIPKLSRQHLLGQHRECCALRGNGWGRKHSVVDYVFTYSPYLLYKYHMLIIEEMQNRGYKPDSLWINPLYRGKTCESYDELQALVVNDIIYQEHNDDYLYECINNMKQKGFDYITMED
jgi:uncharacterized protein (TIGR02328 family)